MNKAIQFGAGNIGRGFIGAVLEQAGYHVVYADINQSVIDEINKRRSYLVRVMDTESYDQAITNISAVNSSTDEVIHEIKDASIITTAVGLGVLQHIAPALAKGLRKRKEEGVHRPLNIIACENGIRATTQLKNEIFKSLEDHEIKWSEEHVGFPDCSVDRIVPPIRTENIIDVIVEDYYEWNVEKKSIVGDLSSIPGMTLVDDLMVSIERKLFTLNTGHAVAAYLGLLRGLSTIDQSIQDKEILKVVRAAMQESGMALIKRYDLDKDEHFKYIEKIIARFKNPYLNDDLNRVGREPIRKLSKNDRLIRPLIMAQLYGVDTNNLELGIAAALHYDNPSDIQSIEMQESIKSKGVKQTLSDISEMDINNPALERISNLYDNII